MLVYSARVLENIYIQPGHWEYQRVGIFCGDGDAAEQIGEYERNYSQFYNTFYAFHNNGKDYALYSPRYTGTSLMELPSCRDIGEEPLGGYGFCPVDFYVPSYIEGPPRGIWTPRVIDPTPKQLATPGMGPLTYYPFGFVAGCIWGDDNDWKIQYLDLSDVASGIVRRDERFGYIALGRNQRLRDAINLHGYGWLAEDDEETYRIQITAAQRFDLRDGARVHPFE